jgi:hypothetical protein
MVLINNKQFTVYNLDSFDSILDRIAASFNSIPKFLYFPNGMPTIEIFNKKDTNIVVEDLFNIIKKSNIDDFQQLYNLVKEKNNISLIDIIKLYMIYNNSFISLESILDIDNKKTYLFYLLDKLKNEISLITTDTINIIDIYNNINNNYYENLIIDNKIKAEKKEYEFTEFQRIIGIPFDPFELEIILFEIDLNINTVFLLEVFNELKLTDFTPFASCLNFYKIRKEFVPPLDWGIINDDKLVIKILQKEEFANDISDYTDFIIETETDISSPNFNKLKATLNYNIKNNIPKEQILNRFTDIIERNNTKILGNIKEKGINGVFYFPNQKLNKYIFADLVLNNTNFSTYLNIDETLISQKPTVYIYFYTEELGEIKAFLTEKIVDKKDPSIRNKKNFIEDSYYVRVRISKARDTKSVEEFQKILSKLFVKYNNEYDNILKFYEKFVPLNELEMHKKPKILNTRDKNARNLLAPEIFLTNYTSFCGKAPTIIPDEDEELELAKGRQVMTFPKNDSEGSQPRKYICEYKKFSYPGVRLNNLNNSDIFKYLPCCFENDQTNKPEYRNYYFDEEITDTTTDQYIITSNKFLKNKQIGRLPKNINAFFQVINDDKNYEYFRIGVLRTKNTFINCVLFALGLITDENEETLETIRRNISTEEFAAACKQEMFDYSIEDISDKIANMNEYFNPNFFIHLLELKYNCNIILFTRDYDNIDGTLLLPRHVKGYFKTNNKFEKCIFIYEHNGINSDNEKFPHCELICRWNKAGKKDDLEYSFAHDSIITQNALKIYETYNEFLILNKQVNFINFNLIDTKILTQTIDFYGKIRLLNIEYKGNKITLFTTPLQPIIAKNEEEFIVYKQDVNIIEDFIRENKGEKLKISNNIYKCKIGDISIKIPLKNSDIQSVSEYSSVIKEYNLYKKLSRYILQYFFWLFSKYLKNNNLTYDETSIETFAKNNIIIDSNFVYGNVTQKYIIGDSLFKGERLVLKNEETLKRLIYLLKIEYIRNPEKLLTYYDKQYIENYYLDISDFDSYSFQIIIYGDEAIPKFIQTSIQDDIQYKLYDNILKETIHPYFFKNNLIDKNVYLAQNTLSIKQAFEIYINWNNKKYNISYNPKDSEKAYGFMFYAYKNNKTIESYYIKDEINTNIKIIGYKVTRQIEDIEETKTLYTILLPIKK